MFRFNRHHQNTMYFILNKIMDFFGPIYQIIMLQKFFIYQLIHKRISLKILKFTLKMLRHVSV